MTRDHTQAKILRILRDEGGEPTVTELATRLGVHPNTVRFHLDTLVARGQVEHVPTAPRGPGRPALRVRAVAGMDPSGPRHYRALAEMLVLGLSGRPDRAETAQRAGRMWGERLATPADAATGDAISVLMTTLEALDFAPERLAADEIGLRNCPFLELADPTRDVVCPVHLGLMRGVLDSLDTRWDVVRLEPFARPELCVAHLAERAAAA